MFTSWATEGRRQNRASRDLGMSAPRRCGGDFDCRLELRLATGSWCLLIVSLALEESQLVPGIAGCDSERRQAVKLREGISPASDL